MIDNLKRIREPLAWALIAILVAKIILGLSQLWFQHLAGVPLGVTFQQVGSSLMSVSLVAVTVILVCLGWFIPPALPRAYLIARTTAWVLTVGVGLTLVFWLLGVVTSQNSMAAVLEFVGGLLDLVVKAIAAGTVWVLISGVGAGRISTEPVVATDPVLDAATTSAATEDTEVAEDSGAEPEIMGAVWRTAGDAAAGLPGSEGWAVDKSGPE